MTQASKQELINQLRGCGLRATGQRLAVLTALRADRSHPSAEDIHAKLSAVHPTLSLSTVYKTLGVLAEAGILYTIDAGTGKQRFEGQLKPHHHAVCRRCGRVIDVDFGMKSRP